MRDIVFHQLLLEYTRLRVSAIEDCDFICRFAGGEQILYFSDYDDGFLKVCIGTDELQFLTGLTAGIGVLGDLAEIFLYQAVGRRDYALCRAVVLLQLEYLGVGIQFGEREDVVNLGSAKRIYALCIVAHDTDDVALLRELCHNLVLGEVGVLVFIHQYISEHLCIAAAHLRVVVE